jgi:hypothetical protein
VRSNGLPRGHIDLNDGYPGLSKNLLEGILISKVFPTSLRPEVVKNEATEDVQWLPGVGESTSLVGKELGRVVFALDGRFTQERKGPGDRNVMGRLPFVLDFLVSFPSALTRSQVTG